MMKLIFLAAFLALTGCGHKDNAPAVAATSAAVAVTNNFQGGTCGDQVTSDFQDLRVACRDPRGRDSEHRCRELAGTFLRKYPQASCSAQVADFSTGELRTILVEERKVREILVGLQDDHRYGAGRGGVPDTGEEGPRRH